MNKTSTNDAASPKRPAEWTPENTATRKPESAAIWTPETTRNRIAAHFDEIEGVARWLRESGPFIEELAGLLIGALQRGGRLYVFGNGGSASQAAHFATELTGRFRRNRRPLPAQALPADGSLLTCIANDFQFADVFARQVDAFVRPGDAAVGLSTSGRSANVLQALDGARQKGGLTVGMCGRNDDEMQKVCDRVVAVPSQDTARIQEGHLAVIHLLCEYIDDAFD